MCLGTAQEALWHEMEVVQSGEAEAVARFASLVMAVVGVSTLVMAALLEKVA